MKIAAKLGIGFGALWAFLLVLGLFQVFQVRRIEREIDKVASLWGALGAVADEMEINLVETGLSILGYLEDRDPGHLERIRADEADFREQMERYEALAPGPELRELGRRASQGYSRFLQTGQGLIQSADEEAERNRRVQEKLETMDAILDEKIQPSVQPDDPQALPKLRLLLKLEINVKGLGGAGGLPEPRQEEFERLMAEFETLALSSREEEYFVELRLLFVEALDLARQIVALNKTRQSGIVEFAALRREMDDLLDDELQALVTKELERSKAAGRAAADTSVTVIQVVLVVALSFGGLAAAMTAGPITRRLSGLTRATRALAAGDLSRRIVVDSNDELALLGRSFNEMAGRLEEETGILRCVLEQMGDGAVVCDTRGRFTHFNDAGKKLVGPPAGDGDPSSWSEKYGVFHLDGAMPYPAADLPLARALRGEPSDNAELLIRNPAVPEGRIISVTARPLKNAGGTLVGGAAIFRDITAQKRAEAELRDSHDALEVRVRERTAELERSMALLREEMETRKRLEAQFLQAQKLEAIGRLAGGVAHDFNNLLLAISGYTEFALAQVPPSHAIVPDLKEVLAASQRAASLTRQLLAFSRKQIIEPKTVNLGSLVGGIEKMLRRLIGEDIDLVTLTKPDLGLVLVDPGQLEQVLVNLAVNARDAMPTGGRLTIETENVTLGSDYAEGRPEVTPGECVVVTVTDSGTGMTEEVRARLFEPFFTTKGLGKGTGLGLATCHGIVKQAGGHIWVYSEPGKGTAFKIYLPRVVAAAPSEARAEAVKPPGGRETLLLVEDEPAVRAVAARVLRGAGYMVLEAGDGEEALKVIGTQRVDLLVTDVVMPRMGGSELAGRLKIKALFTSGYTDDTVVRHGILESGIAFLQKPYSSAALLQKVREVLDQ